MKVERLYEMLLDQGCKLENVDGELCVSGCELVSLMQLRVKACETELLALLPSARDSAGADALATHEQSDEVTETPNPEPSWVGQRVKIEDLPDFKAKHGLLTVSSEWPHGEPCPVLVMTEAKG